MFSPTHSISSLIPDHPHLSILEKKCTTMKDLQMIHTHLIKAGLAHDTAASGRLLAFSATSTAGDINYAYLLFTQIQNPNLFAWNTIIRGFSQSSTPQNAISLFIHMLTYSSIQSQRLTYPSLFKAYTQLGQAHEGAQLHARIIKLGLQVDPFIRNTLIYMYANCGFLFEAQKIFRQEKDCDVVAWNSMITGLAKSGEIDEARRLFNIMPLRTEISWNSMISGYVRNEKIGEALDLFSEMQVKGIVPCKFTMVSLLNASARLGSLKQGEWIHEYIKKNKIELNPIIVTAIIDMYCKCGSIKMALQVFENTAKKGLSCWNSMILGQATNGCADEAIQLFSRLESSNLKPNDVTFIGVLTACNHSGSVQMAKDYFTLMIEKYKIEPSVKHYGCMVDMLGRAGLVEEAEELIRSMPMNPDAIIWGSLLSACRRNGNVEIAKRAEKFVIEADPNESCGYVLMSNVYAGMGRFEEAIEQRHKMKERNMEKEPGCSLIEVNGEVHEFVAGGRLHPRIQEIYVLLHELSLMLRDTEPSVFLQTHDQ